MSSAAPFRARNGLPLPPPDREDIYKYLRVDLKMSREQVGALTDYEIFDVLLRDRARRAPPKPLPKDPREGFVHLLVAQGVSREDALARYATAFGRAADGTPAA